MEYRKLTETDMPLLACFVDDQHTVYKKEQLSAFLSQKNAAGFVAAEEEKIVGFAYGWRMIKPDGRCVFYLHAIDVMKEYQGRGCGTALMRFIHEQAKGMGCEKMFLLTEEENRAACACYEHAGGKKRQTVLYTFA